ncbi:MAG: hypothetical protein ACI9YH_004797, partial [Colwellia sp.]
AYVRYLSRISIEEVFRKKYKLYEGDKLSPHII